MLLTWIQLQCGDCTDAQLLISDYPEVTSGTANSAGNVGELDSTMETFIKHLYSSRFNNNTVSVLDGLWIILQSFWSLLAGTLICMLHLNEAAFKVCRRCNLKTWSISLVLKNLLFLVFYGNLFCNMISLWDSSPSAQ